MSHVPSKPQNPAPQGVMRLAGAAPRSIDRRRRIAFSLTIAAGLIVIFFSTWPLPVLVVSDASIFVTWGMIGNGVGLLCLVAAYLIRRGRPIAPLVLTGCGLLLLTAWLATGRLDRVALLHQWPLALGVDLLPILLTAMAAWITVNRPQPALAEARVS